MKTIKKANRLVNKLEMFCGRDFLFSRPQGVQIEPTNRCNQKCVMCARNAGLDVPVGDLSLENFKKIMGQLPGVRNLLLNGLGEPLLNKDLPEMIKFASSRGVAVSINSNCALIDDSLAVKLVDSGLRLVKISMDSADADTYRSIRGADMAPSINGIKALVKARKEKNSRLPELWFNSIIMKQNYRDLIGILKLGESLGVDLVRFKPVNVFDLHQNENFLTERDELKKTIKETMEAAKGIKIGHNLAKLLSDFDIYYRPKEKIPCYSPWTELYIQHYGGVRLCCEFYSGKYDIGNMLEESFESVWNGPRMRQIRRQFKKGETNFPVCRNCNRFQKNILIHRKIGKIKNFYKLNS